MQAPALDLLARRPSARRSGSSGTPSAPRNSRSFPISEMLKNISFKIAGDRDLFHRIRQFSARNPQPRRAARIVASHQVRSVAQKFGYVQAVFDLRDNLLRRLCSRLQEIVSRPNPRSSRQPARSVGGSLQAQLLRGVGVQQIRLQARRFRSRRVRRVGMPSPSNGLVPKPPSMVPSSITVDAGRRRSSRPACRPGTKLRDTPSLHSRLRKCGRGSKSPPADRAPPAHAPSSTLRAPSRRSVRWAATLPTCSGDSSRPRLRATENQ